MRWRTRLLDPARRVVSPALVLVMRAKVCAWTASGIAPVQLRHAKSRTLLGLLVLQPGRPLSREEAAAALFPDQAAPAAYGALRQLVADLRQAFIAVGLESSLVLKRSTLSWQPAGDVFDELEWHRIHPYVQTWPAWLVPLADHGEPWLEGAPIDTDTPAGAALLDARYWLAQRLKKTQPRVARTLRAAWCAFWYLELFAPPGSVESMERRSRVANQVAEHVRSWGGWVQPVGDDAVMAVFGLCGDVEHVRSRAWQAIVSASTHLLKGWRWAAAVDAGYLRAEPDSAGNPRVVGDEWQTACDLVWRAHGDGIWVSPRMADACPLVGQSVAPSDMSDPWAWLPSDRLCIDISGADVAGLDSPLIGRQELVDTLAGVWANAAAHEQPVWLQLQGVAGVGKTRLAWELALLLRGRGARVHWLAAEAGDRVAWTSLARWIRWMMPDQAGAEPVLPGQPLSPEAAKTLGHALHTVLGSGEDTTAAGLIVIDDAMWVDFASAELLKRTLSRLRHILVLTLWRDSPSSVGAHPLAEGAVYTVAPLSDAEAAALLHTAHPPFELSSQIECHVRQGGGLPLLLRQPPLPIQGEIGSTAELQDRWQAIAQRIPTWLRTTLERSAWLGEPLTPGATAPNDWAALVSAGIVRPAAGGGWVFSHSAWSDCIARSIDDRVRHGMSAQVAQAAQDEGRWAHAAAWWERAGEREQALAAWQRAAHAATAAADHAGALHAYDRIAALGYAAEEVGLWQRVAHVRAACAVHGFSSRQAVALANDLAADPVAMRRYPQAAYSLLAMRHVVAIAKGQRSALPIIEQMLQLAATPAQRFHALGLRACATLLLGQWDTAEADSLAALALARDLPPEQRRRYFPSDMRTFVAAQLTWLQWLRGNARWRHTLEELGQWLKAPEASDADRLIAACYRGHLHRMSGDAIRQRDEAAAVLSLPHATQWPLWRGLAWLLHADAQAQLGEPTAVSALNARAQAVANADVGYAVPAAVLVASALIHQGEYAAAMSWLTPAAERSESAHTDLAMEVQRLRALALDGMGQAGEAAQALTRAQAQASRLGALGWLQHWGSRPADHALLTIAP